MRIFRDAAVAVFFCVLTLLSIKVYFAVDPWQTAAVQTAAEFHSQSVQALKLQSALTASVYRIADDADGILEETKGALDWITNDMHLQLADLNRTVARTTDRMEVDFDSQLTAAQTSLARTTAGAGAAVSGASEIERQISDALPLFLDCDHNPDCVFNRYVGMARGLEKMSQAWGAEAKPISRHVEKTTEDVERIADKFTQPRSSWGKLWDGVKTAAYVISRFL